jgi:hypothetical protein
MIKQMFDVDGYWKVIIFYNVNDDFFIPIYKELESIGFSLESTKKIFRQFHKNAKAVTCSNGAVHKSIVLFKSHSSTTDYLNSIVHEAEHIKQAMLIAYNVEDAGEPPAYTIGYLVSKMYQVFRYLICPCEES